MLLSCLDETEGFIFKRVNTGSARRSGKAKKMLKKELRLARKTAKEMKLVERYLKNAMALRKNSAYNF